MEIAVLQAQIEELKAEKAAGVAREGSAKRAVRQQGGSAQKEENPAQQTFAGMEEALSPNEEAAKPDIAPKKRTERKGKKKAPNHSTPTFPESKSRCPTLS